MTVYKKLKIAILTILATQTIHAITLEPLQVMSTSGDLLYAELNFSHADLASNLQVSLATPEDLMGLGLRIVQQPPAQLNFYTRRNGHGAGVIIITSSRPFNQSELDIVLKIKEGNGTRLQHIKQPINRKAAPVIPTTDEKPLSPQFIVSEKDIAINLPESTQYAISNTTPADVNLPPKIATHQAAELSANHRQVLTINTTTQTTLQTAVASAPEKEAKPQVTDQSPPAHLSIKETIRPPQDVSSLATPQSHMETQSTAAPNAAQLTDKPKENSTPPLLKKASTLTSGERLAKENLSKVKDQPVPQTKASTQSQHIVQHHESLWRIANRIALQTHQPISQVMQQIAAHNSHAFVQGDINRLRQGVALNFSAVMNPSPQNKVKSKAPTRSTQVSGRAKYRLNQAQMSLVADNQQDSTQGSAKHSTNQHQSNAKLQLKVMTAREKTIKLQQSVTEMELALRQKDQRIQLLNARLAQLQQQLKEQEKTQKPIH